ncbi:MAG: hypothetical protein FJ284_14470 [Planctomycetes bacterium]|nr:hypothetical protein [Planctomycetota bacterium]MBM4023412.1 hypothetical protein [Planctomycetota bacterium]
MRRAAVTVCKSYIADVGFAFVTRATPWSRPGGSMARIFSRLLAPPKKTFLLLGPRGTGKSTWLANHFPRAVRIDLLHAEQLYRYRSNPSLLRSDLGGLRAGEWAVIDEAQKVPDLLDEIHGLYEARRINFAITGSSARKLRRADVNLLGGRAIRCDFSRWLGQRSSTPRFSMRVSPTGRFLPWLRTRCMRPTRSRATWAPIFRRRLRRRH